MRYIVLIRLLLFNWLLELSNSVTQAALQSSDPYLAYNVQPPEQRHCPSLEAAETLTMTQLIATLTANCRYDRLEPPYPLGVTHSSERSPVRVYARIRINVLQNLDSSDLQFKVQGLLQLRYMDARLAYEKYAPQRAQPVMGERALRELIWVPHIFISNEHSSRVLGTDQNDLLTSISPNGTIVISTRIQTALYCWMNFQKFPFDDQYCTMSMESWRYNTSKQLLRWEPYQPVSFKQQLRMTEFSVSTHWHNETVVVSDSADMARGALSGNYSAISFTVKFEREMGYYILDYFLPSMMIVAISWVSFWLQPDQTPARTTLGTSTLLSFITLALSQENNLSKVSYITFSEVWFLGCTFFIIAGLAEFAFVNTIWRRSKNLHMKKKSPKHIFKSTLKSKRWMQQQLPNDCTIITIDGGDLTQSMATFNEVCLTPNPECHDEDQRSETESTMPTEATHPTWATMTPREVAMWIDRQARFLFPLAFVGFNALFWIFVFSL